MSIRKHILEDLHKSLGATFGEFAGWSVPMSYEGTLKEHMAVRREAGIFDISHMGRMVVKGEGATELLERIYTKRVSKTKVGFMSGPTLALNEYARVKDDEMPYRLGEDEWLIVPNAAVADAMLEYFRGVASNMGINISITDLRDRYALLALQGPRSTEVMERLGGGDLLDLKPLQFKENVSIAGATAYIVSRSGWTGEDGFEIIAEVEEAKKF